MHAFFKTISSAFALAFLLLAGQVQAADTPSVQLIRNATL